MKIKNRNLKKMTEKINATKKFTLPSRIKIGMLVGCSLLVGSSIGQVYAEKKAEYNSEVMATFEAGEVKSNSFLKKLKSTETAKYLFTNELVLQVYSSIYGEKITEEMVDNALNDLNNESDTLNDESDIRKTLKQQLALEYGVKKNIKVTEGELQTAWANYHTPVKLKYMLLDDKGNWEEVIAQLDDGADFETVAKKYTLDSNEGETVTYNFTDTFLPSKLMKKVYSLSNGEYVADETDIDGTSAFFVVKMVENSSKGKERSKYEKELTTIVKQDKFENDSDLVNEIISTELNKANVKVVDNSFIDALDSLGLKIENLN